MGDLSLLCASDVLSHLDDAVHGHLGVGLDQAVRQTEERGCLGAHHPVSPAQGMAVPSHTAPAATHLRMCLST